MCKDGHQTPKEVHLQGGVLFIHVSHPIYCEIDVYTCQLLYKYDYKKNNFIPVDVTF